MKWQNFKEKLQNSSTFHLQFQYADSKLVDPSFHITEIKQAPITSVDCGGVMNKWTEIIIQLYEPEIREQDRSMTVNKALSIIELVERSLPLDPDAEVKIEFGNATFDTRQMLPSDITVDGDNLLIDLRPDAVQCKANERGGSCGPSAKPKIQLINLAVDGNSCTPGGGCC
ncbi:DUF6428 family protein [Mucilaginibacter myungsuensis]|uniref:Uncharacterized protein n=1 Tax=Mucilaginibacter myungsuensis TaxID=649104 RepID=A0A929KV11_9SPHI|nr:DUF6428 family protein [Mucilaginibacter myungsuensis]MBE9662096.1 hypothetical protein [Mucilaginibacter myungsuensis]MDN3599470.1 DUF6428 family protein [Mucilaginibacter myungsuensis]